MFNNYNSLAENIKNAEVHQGLSKYEINKGFIPYIWEESGDNLKINIDSIKLALKTVLMVIENAAFSNGLFLFVGHPYDPFMDKIIKTAAKASNQYFYSFKYKKLNYAKIKKQLKALNPTFLIVFTIKPSQPIIKIADQLNIPVIGICNSNTNPKDLTYFIPGNDKSYKSIYFYCSLFVKAILKGKNKV